MTSLTLHNPFSGELVFSQDSETFETVNDKVNRAQAASRKWRELSAPSRADLVENALSYFETHKDDIATGIACEMGKPKMAAEQEIDFMIERAQYMCRFARDGALEAQDQSVYNDNGFEGWLENRAKGVVYIITPWNYPLFCAINGTVCALLSGSAVVLKHTTTPSVGAHFQKAFGTLGDVEDLLHNVTIDYDTSARLIEETDINHVIFTGSVQGGRIIQQSVAKRTFNDVAYPFIESSLELGSSDAAYIAQDADLDEAVLWAVKIGRLHNSGQSCCAVKRVFVHESLHDAFVDKAREVMEAEINGDPMDPQTTLGPLFGGEAPVNRLMSLIDDAASKGARIICGGQTEKIGQALFIKPTLLSNVNADMDVLNEETFGPVLPVVKVSSDDEAVDMVKQTRFGLTASIFTASRERAMRYIAAMEAGTVYVNRCNFVDARLGWIGHKMSGNGALSLSPQGLSAISATKSVNIDPANLS